MPKRILLIGTLFCFGGVLTIWDIITSLFERNLSLDFSVCLLPVGLGLLKGKPRSQKWARFWIVLGYIYCALFAGLAIFFPENTSMRWAGQDIRRTEALPYTLSLTALMEMALVVMHKLLYSEKALAYFNRSYK